MFRLGGPSSGGYQDSPGLWVLASGQAPLHGSPGPLALTEEKPFSSLPINPQSPLLAYAPFSVCPFVQEGGLCPA